MAHTQVARAEAGAEGPCLGRFELAVVADLASGWVPPITPIREHSCSVTLRTDETPRPSDC